MTGTDLPIHVVSSRLKLELAPEMRAAEAVRVIMRRLMEMMRVNEAGMHVGEDIEFLHNFRIAVRRNRSLLGQIRGVIPQHDRQRFTRGFVWLGEITRSARDLDVYLLNLEDYKKNLVPAVGNELEPLREYILHQQQQAHQQLVNSLKSARYSQLMVAWATFIAAPLSVHSRLPNARLPVLDLANQRIWRMLRRVVRQGKAIQMDSPPQDLHELRKSCKKLRYLIEFFENLYPVGTIKKPIKVLKGLQDVLGEYQDVQMQQAFLSTFKQTCAIDSAGMQSTRMAVDLIMRRLEKHQRKLRKSFKQHFAVFMESQQQKLFKQLFKP